MVRRTFDNFLQLSLRPSDFPAISVKFPCGYGTFRLLPSVRPQDLPSTYTNCQCDKELSTVAEPCGHFHQKSMRLEDLPLISVKFHTGQQMFNRLLSIFLAAGTHSVNLRQLSEWLWKLQSNSVNFPCSHIVRAPTGLSVSFSCGWEILCQLPSTFRASTKTSINFCQFHYGRETLQ